MASTDNVGVVEYEIYLEKINGTSFNEFVVASTTETSCEITDLYAKAKYEFTVKAKDVAGNISDPSSVLQVNTLEDLEPPSKPTGLMIENVTDSSITFSWDPSSDDIKVAGYEIFIKMTMTFNQ